MQVTNEVTNGIQLAKNYIERLFVEHMDENTAFVHISNREWLVLIGLRIDVGVADESWLNRQTAGLRLIEFFTAINSTRRYNNAMDDSLPR